MSKLAEQKSGQLVVPGDRLGVIEEFIPDAGTYVQDGVIYSKVVGHALVDLMHKKVSVFPVGKGAKVPKVGSIVVGQVSSVQTQTASVRFSQVDKKQIAGFFSGVLHVSDVQMRFVESMFDVCKPGDIIRAKVISEKNRTYHLSTQDKELGVVYGFCSNCGQALEQKRQGMNCPRCGKIESRKTAADYGKGSVSIKEEHG
jgi:exosome complex component CSL4